LEKLGVESEKHVIRCSISRVCRVTDRSAEHVASAIDQLLAKTALIARLTAEGAAASWNGFAERWKTPMNGYARLGRGRSLHAVDDSARSAMPKRESAENHPVRTELAQTLTL